MAIGQRRLTLEAFLHLPEQEPALEYVSGVVVQKMSPTGPHSGLQTDFATSFNAFAVPRRLARAFSELRTSFGGFSFVPDVSVYRWERVPADEHGDLAAYATEPPDIAAEIVSPGQALKDLADRCHRYVEHGVRVALPVHPPNRTIRVFRAGAEPRSYGDADRIDLSDAVPGFELDVADLFRSLRARPT